MATVALISIIISVIAFVIVKVEKSKNEEDYKIKILAKEEIGSSRYLVKLSFDGHSYIYLKNTWSCSGDRIMHDPGCECLKIGKEK